MMRTVKERKGEEKEQRWIKGYWMGKDETRERKGKNEG
jgi:hypothetical protein